MTALVGTSPRGASVTSGTVSTVTAIGAGDITLNTVALPAIAAAATAAERVDQLIAAVNSLTSQHGIVAQKVTSTTYKLGRGDDIIVAALAGTATLANCGLTAATTAATTNLLDTRKAFGSSVSGSDQEVIVYGGQEIDVKSAKSMGLMDRIAGADVEITPAATPTRTDA